MRAKVVPSLIVALLLAAGLASIWPLPRLLHPPLSAAQLQGLTAKAQLEVENARRERQDAARATLVQTLAGAVLVLGAYQAYRQLHIAREGQITERFTRAVDQLGSKMVDVRVGGIYALERIARDSESDRATIAEIFSAFLRGHAPRPPEHTGSAFPAGEFRQQFPLLSVRMPDAHAIVNAFTHLHDLKGIPQFDLSGIDLRKVKVDGSLKNANLIRTNLRFAILVGVDLRDAWLNWADVREAVLQSSDLRGAALAEADLRRANLMGADLRGAVLTDADFREADLRGSDLRETVAIEDAKFEQALMDELTRWPEDFDPVAAGVIRDEAAGP